jgi:pimeloyl-ACP methyl ester carboxylesterase
MSQRERVDLSAGPVLYEESGQGKPIVFVHGVFVNGQLWRKVALELADRYRCIAPDWPLGSHSQAMSDDADLSTPGLARVVAEFLERLDLHDVTLVGNDTGGAVCQLVMTDHPDRIGRVVLTSCDAFEVYPPKPFSFLRVVPFVPGLAFLLGQSLRFTFVRRLPISYGWVMNELPAREVMDSYTRPLLDRRIRRDAKKMLRGISKRHTLDAALRLGGFDKPVLLAWAGDDKLFPLSLAQRLESLLPQAQIQVIPGSRTFVSEDRPKDLAVAIADFGSGSGSTPRG